MKYAIEITGLTKTISGIKILNDINLKVKSGEIYGFLGANGAGKTSLMKAVYRMMVAETGTVSLLGETVNNSNNAVFSRIGSIIESPVFYEEFNAVKNLSLHCDYMGGGHNNIDNTLAIFGLASETKKAVKNYSLGMKQRLALARAMVLNPELLILDEPLNGLDPEGITEIRDLLLKINRENKVTILISSHILHELSRIADTIGIIDHGKMLAEISMEEISNKGIDLETYYLEILKGGRVNV